MAGTYGVPFATVADIYGTGTGLSTQQSALDGPLNAQTSGAQMMGGGPSGSSISTTNLLPSLSGINPLVGIAVVLLVLFGVKHLREWKSGDDFKEVKVGLYFIIVTTLAAAAGLPILKAILAKYQIPGLSAYVLNA